MRRIAFLLPVVWICLGSGLIASSTTSYTSPHTKLSYRHTRLAVAGGGDVRTYAIPAPSGELTLTITDAEGEFRIVGEVETTGSKSILSYTPSSQGSPAELALAWPNDRLTARFADAEEPGSLSRIAGAVPDCDKLREGELPRLRNEVFELARADYTSWSDPPTHLQALMAALYFSRNAPLLAGECEDPLQLDAGSCYAGYTQYVDCERCCEADAGIESMICAIAARGACAGGACAGIGGLICRGIAHLSANFCVGHNCSGKAGDPQCDQDQPCEGNCMYFCGPGWSSACGRCEGEGRFHGECCQ